MRTPGQPPRPVRPCHSQVKGVSVLIRPLSYHHCSAGKLVVQLEVVRPDQLTAVGDARSGSRSRTRNELSKGRGWSGLFSRISVLVVPSLVLDLVVDVRRSDVGQGRSRCAPEVVHGVRASGGRIGDDGSAHRRRDARARRVLSLLELPLSPVGAQLPPGPHAQVLLCPTPRRLCGGRQCLQLAPGSCEQQRSRPRPNRPGTAVKEQQLG